VNTTRRATEARGPATAERRPTPTHRSLARLYTFRKGLPYPTFDDGAPASLEIIGMCPAVAYEEDRFQGTVPLGDPPGSLSGLPDLPEGLRSEHDADGRRPRYGSGMMASFTRGAGTVFNAGASQWVAGVIHQDWFVERITRNVLDRFSR
jgi:hypothetical protein